MTRSVRYQPIFNALKFTLYRARVLNNVVITTITEMVEMVEILDGRVGKRSVERVRYVINNLLHLVIVKYGVISLVLCISTRLRLVTILTLLVKYLVIFQANPCNTVSLIYYILPSLTVHFPMMRSARYQPIFNGLKFMLHSARVLNNVVKTTVIEMVEMVEILDGRGGVRSVERVRYVINNLLHLVIVKYGVISLVLCISTRLRLVTILTLLMKYLVIFHADPCNKSYYVGMSVMS